MIRRALAAMLAIGLLTGCKSKEEKQAEEMQKAAETLAKGFENAAKEVNKSASAIVDANAKPVDPVSFKELQKLLPELAGWQRDDLRGERMTAPISYAEASTTYHKGDAAIDVTLTDSGFAQALLAPLAMALAGNFSRETSDGYEKSVTVDGAPGFENWNKSDKSGDLKLLLAKRFLVTIEGHGIDDPKLLRTVLDKIDAKKLAGLK